MRMTRRQMVKSTGFGAAAVALRGIDAAPPSAVKALVFDTFGTVVDWRGSIIEEGRTFAKRKGFELDWGDFAERWRAGYAPAMDRVRKGQMAWTNQDALHRMILDEIMT